MDDLFNSNSNRKKSASALKKIFAGCRWSHGKRRDPAGDRLDFETLEMRRLLAANEPPVNFIPGTQETWVETPLAFTQYRENSISISDPDAGNLEVEMQLEATNGLVTLVNRNLVASGLTYLIGDGLDDTVVKVRGKIDDINTAL